ncbi:MAG: beta-eliminating lyase-related protein [Pseudomonadota bacterium]
MWFTSDNAAGAPPEVLRAMAAAAEGGARSYGADDVTERARAAIREAFEAPEAAVEFVATGTAANSLALACLAPPWGVVYAHEKAHIEEDECAAPEFFTGGAKLRLLPGADGKIGAEALADRLAAAPRDVHSPQPAALSLTQATEAGAIYRVEEIAALSAAAGSAGCAVHMDGTRFANALAATNASPAEMSWRAGVDILCLGFTKNGAPAAEAVILFDPAKAREFELRRKRAGHLWSKMRFVSAQAAAMMEDGLWLRLASHANAMAARLTEGLAEIEGLRILHPVEANLIFVEMEAEAHRAAEAAGARYHARPVGNGGVGARLVCSFATTEEDVNGLLDALRRG